MTSRTTPDFTPLSPLTMGILIALGEQDHHGYALLREVERQSGGSVTAGTGSLYAALQRLMDEGWIADSPDLPGPEEDRRRKYYTITEAGREAVRLESERMLTVLREAHRSRLIPDPAPVHGGEG